MTLADAIRTESLTKYYGPVVALESLDLSVATGEIYGFLGPNGAGKTTTIRILLDLVRATSGRARVDGLDCRAASVDVRRRIGYLPAEMPLYREMTGAAYLRFLAALESRPVDHPTPAATDTSHRGGARSSVQDACAHRRPESCIRFLTRLHIQPQQVLYTTLSNPLWSAHVAFLVHIAPPHSMLSKATHLAILFTHL